MPNHPIRALLATVLLLSCAQARADEPTVLRDLDSSGRSTLAKAELDALLPGATISRVSAKGNTQIWRNDPDGSFIISSDNNNTVRKRPTTAPGKWHISADGRYCVLIEWANTPVEEWCRYILKSGDRYYATRSDSVGTEKIHRLEISR